MSPTAFRPLTPLDYLERSAYVFREKIAVVDGDVRRTYPQLRDRVYRLAAALQSLGIRDGERVAVMSPNSSAILEAHFAVPLAGGVLCALNIRLTVPEIDYILGHCGASILIYDSDFDEFVRELKPKMRCIRVPDAYEALIAAADPQSLDRREVDEDDTISINYTSGTTGRPKGVMYTVSRRVRERASRDFPCEHASGERVSVDVAHVPLQRVDISVRGDCRGRDACVLAQGRSEEDSRADRDGTSDAHVRRPDRLDHAGQRSRRRNRSRTRFTSRPPARRRRRRSSNRWKRWARR